MLASIQSKLIIDIWYIVAAILFILGLKMLSSPTSARRGNLLSSTGMLIAIIATLCIAGLNYKFIIVGLIVGILIGLLSAQMVAMTAMPEMVALFNGFGGIASLLVGWAEFHENRELLNSAKVVAIFFTVLIGGITFSGSLIALGKLAEKIPGKPILFRGQGILNLILLIIVFTCGAAFAFPGSYFANYNFLFFLVILSLILGVLAVIPIGGADMPVVISLLNSYSGLAACAAGLVIINKVLIVAGALVGASGFILTNIMCKAMNRTLSNVLFSGFGASGVKDATGIQGTVNPISPEDAYLILEAASSVVVTPGYGMAVAQAQHVVRELGEVLSNSGKDVKYAIHPVAGRMPGHMNVLLAEANVSYDQLVEPDDVNPVMESVDVCIVIGANDVVNPAARDEKSSPIYGMPIIEVDRAKTVFVLKRSMATGFAGIDNTLFFKENTRMLFGDAKTTVSSLLTEFKSS